MADSDESKLSGAKRRAPDSTVPAPTAGGSPVPGAGAGAGAGSSSSATAGSNWGRRLTPEEEARRARFVTNRKAHNPLYYSDYLQLDKILGAQAPVSNTVTKGGAHDEHLFIVIHQVYELWFKQILHEVGSVIDIFSMESVPEHLVSVAVARLERVTEIQRVLLDQIKILETMSPLDFLDFRDYLFPASGFQSKQFRLLENRLGLKEGTRVKFGKARYCSYLSAKDSAEVVAAEHALPTLYDVVQRWLERTPFIRIGEFDTWDHYKKAVDAMLRADEDSVNHGDYTAETRAELLSGIAGQRRHFETLVDPSKYAQLQERGEWRLSHKATIAALLISLYKEQPVFHVPARLLSLLVDIDEFLTAWRYRHALMVHRMLGVKIGTGGSSGYHYLRSTAQHHKIFSDFANLATFLIPRHSLPPLPDNVSSLLGFASATPSPPKKQRTEPDPEPATATAANGDAQAAAASVPAPARCPMGHGTA